MTPHEKLEWAPILPIVLIDGECVMCNWVAQFIYKHEEIPFFFGTLASSVGQALLETYEVDPRLDSVVFISETEAFVQSDAIIEIAKGLRFPWSFLRWIALFPRPIRNFGYRMVARYRYQWFGKKENCLIDQELQQRIVNAFPLSSQSHEK